MTSDSYLQFTKSVTSSQADIHLTGEPIKIVEHVTRPSEISNDYDAEKVFAVRTLQGCIYVNSRRDESV